ncbi:MAG: M23 family metallopeptidase [Brevinema sp.]
MSVIKKETLKIETIVPKQDLRFYSQEALDRNVFLKFKKFLLETKTKVHNFGIRRFSIMMTPHIGSKGFTIHISNYLLLFLGTVSSISILSVVYILAQGHQSTRNQVRLVVENDALEEKIFQVSETVDSLSEYFSKFRVEVGSIIIPATDNNAISFLDNPMLSIESNGSTPREIVQLQKLEKELDVTKERIFHIGNFMQENQRILREMPSIYPLATRARITSRFGIRRNPFDQRGVEGHDGLDMATLPGTPVYASADGVVQKAGVQGGYGNMIELRHKYQFTTRYGHLQGFASQIYPGARVKQGQVIGYVGATGRVTGYHLHYEVLIGGSRVDPEPFAMMLR